MEKTDATGQRIVGLNTENAKINEGLVRFDIIFYVRMPSIVGRKNGLSQIIVNIEAQKDEPTEYKILKLGNLLCEQADFVTKGKRFCKY